MHRITLSLLFVAACANATRPAPTLPSADALRDWWRDGAPLSAGLELCVAPSGEVTDVRLARSSGDRLYDEAVVHDVARWTDTALAPSCRPATVTYVP